MTVNFVLDCPSLLAGAYGAGSDEKSTANWPQNARMEPPGSEMHYFMLDIHLTSICQRQAGWTDVGNDEWPLHIEECPWSTDCFNIVSKTAVLYDWTRVFGGWHGGQACCRPRACLLSTTLIALTVFDEAAACLVTYTKARIFGSKKL